MPDMNNKCKNSEFVMSEEVSRLLEVLYMDIYEQNWLLIQYFWSQNIDYVVFIHCHPDEAIGLKYMNLRKKNRLAVNAQH